MPTTKLGWDGSQIAAVYYGDSKEDTWAIPECIEHLTFSEPDFRRDKNGNMVCVHCKDKDTPRYVPDNEFLSTLKWDVYRRDENNQVLDMRHEVPFSETNS